MYAFDEFPDLLADLPGSARLIDSENLRYMCALVAELTYYHVPQFEIDERKRTKLVPSFAHNAIVSAGRQIDVRHVLNDPRLEGKFEGRFFVIVTEYSVVVGIVFGEVLFIGFRGTQLMLDGQFFWGDLIADFKFLRRSSPTISESIMLHRGFLSEAEKITQELHDPDVIRIINSARKIVITGHSLGGAVAAIVGGLNPKWNQSVCTIAAPRYASRQFVEDYMSPVDFVSIARLPDIITHVPPKSLGYSNNYGQINTDGTQAASNGFFEFIKMERAKFGFMMRFLLPRKMHAIETYRREMGRFSDAALWNSNFINTDFAAKISVQVS